MQNLANVRRAQERNGGGDEGLIALVGQRRGGRAWIVAGYREHAAMGRCADRVAMLDRIAGAIEARIFRVPNAEHASVFAAADGGNLLRAADGGRGDFFVETRFKMDMVVLEQRFRLPEREIDAAERRAAIARDEAAGRQSGARIAPPLVEREPDDRLHAGQEDLSAFQHILVVERYRRHGILRWRRTLADVLRRPGSMAFIALAPRLVRLPPARPSVASDRRAARRLAALWCSRDAAERKPLRSARFRPLRHDTAPARGRTNSAQPKDHAK